VRLRPPCIAFKVGFVYTAPKTDILPVIWSGAAHHPLGHAPKLALVLLYSITNIERSEFWGADLSPLAEISELMLPNGAHPVPVSMIQGDYGVSMEEGDQMMQTARI
jgi:hypothetical protein